MPGISKFVSNVYESATAAACSHKLSHQWELACCASQYPWKAEQFCKFCAE